MMKQKDVQVGQYYYETMTNTTIFVTGKVGVSFVSYVRHKLEDGKPVEKNGTIQSLYLIQLYAFPEPPICLAPTVLAQLSDEQIHDEAFRRRYEFEKPQGGSRR